MTNHLLRKVERMITFNNGLTPLLLWGIIFFKLNGLFPCIVKKSPSLWFSPSKLWIIYHTILSGIFTYTNFCLGIPEIVQKYSSTDLPTRMVLEIAQLATATCISIAIWILYIFNGKKITAIANGIVKSDLMLTNFCRSCPSGHSALQFYIFVPIYLISWSILIWTEVVLSPNINPWYIEICIYIVPSFTITSFILQYTVSVNLMQKRLKALNNLMLKHILDDRKNEIRREPMVIHDPTVMKEFENWKTIHDELYILMTMIAEFYSLLILFVLGYLCFTIIFCSFYVISHLKGSDLEERLLLITNGMLWIGMSFLLPAILIFQIQSVNTETNRKGIICHKLLRQYSEHKRFKQKIEIYSLELLHENCAFTAFGFFPLNATFLQSVITTTVTYLVIILQFEESTDALED